MKKIPYNYTVDQRTGCWKWSTGKNRYYTIYRNGRYIVAHRWVYMQKVGKIPKGKQLDHLCLFKGCVNPDHLELVTANQNMHRRIVNKLNPEKVKKIRRLYRTGRYTQVDLSFEYGVHQSTIGRVVNHKRWEVNTI